MPNDRDESMAALERAISQAEQVMAQVSTDQLPAATPCDDWTVSDLIAHLVADPANFIAMAQGDQPDWSASPSLPDDWTAEFRAGGDRLLQSWRDAGDEAAPQSMDWQTAEFAVHTWDLVRALGQSRDLDPGVAERGFGFMSTAMTPDNRGSAFGPEVEAAVDAASYDRLAAFAGRDPGWQPRDSR